MPLTRKNSNLAGRDGAPYPAANKTRERPLALPPPTQEKGAIVRTVHTGLLVGGWWVDRSDATGLHSTRTEATLFNTLRRVLEKRAEARGVCTTSCVHIYVCIPDLPDVQSSFSGTTCSWTKISGRGCSRSTPPLRSARATGKTSASRSRWWGTRSTSWTSRAGKRHEQNEKRGLISYRPARRACVVAREGGEVGRQQEAGTGIAHTHFGKILTSRACRRVAVKPTHGTFFAGFLPDPRFASTLGGSIWRSTRGTPRPSRRPAGIPACSGQS